MAPGRAVWPLRNRGRAAGHTVHPRFLSRRSRSLPAPLRPAKQVVWREF
jgi:hypothetical protein